MAIVSTDQILNAPASRKLGMFQWELWYGDPQAISAEVPKIRCRWETLCPKSELALQISWIRFVPHFVNIMMNGSCESVGLNFNSISSARLQAAFVAPAKRMSLYRKWNMHRMSGCTQCKFRELFLWGVLDGDRLANECSQYKWKCFFWVSF